MELIGIFFLSILVSSGFFYTLIMVMAKIGLIKIKYPQNKNFYPSVSVIIAAKDEEDHIGETLDRVLTQDYPHDKYEVILLNDASSDKTLEIAQEKAKYYDNLRVINLGVDCPYASRKKYALDVGIKSSTGEVLMFTDADCKVNKKWVRTIAQCYDEKGKVGIVSGMVTLARAKKRNLFMKIQEIDYIVVTLVASGFFGIGYPVGANGNNFSYRRSLFDKVNGFKGIEHMLSGDDDLMLDKMVKMSKCRVVFCDAYDAQVYTAPTFNLKSFINQRCRWASKNFNYQRFFLNLMYVMIWAFNVSLLFGWVFSIISPFVIPFYLGSLGLKTFLDGMIILPNLKKLKRADLMPYFLPTEIFHIPYVVFIGIVGTFGGWSWKNVAPKTDLVAAQKLQKKLSEK
ncbi:MAG: glycosyltransferase [Spirochaetales bacterium]|nr:glycosyltransferase [Spirochaetales bacterium]